MIVLVVTIVVFPRPRWCLFVLRHSRRWHSRLTRRGIGVGTSAVVTPVANARTFERRR